MKKTAQTVTVRRDSDKVTVSWDPEKGGFDCLCEQGLPVARGLLLIAEKELTEQTVKTSETTIYEDLTIDCDSGAATALGLVIMAKDFFEMSFKIQCQQNIVAQASQLVSRVPGRIPELSRQ